MITRTGRARPTTPSTASRPTDTPYSATLPTPWDNLAPLASFARNLRRDQAAVHAGLTLGRSSGQVEGTVNKIKMLKRQMFGAPTSISSASESCTPADWAQQSPIRRSAPDPGSSR